MLVMNVINRQLIKIVMVLFFVNPLHALHLDEQCLLDAMPLTPNPKWYYKPATVGYNQKQQDYSGQIQVARSVSNLIACKNEKKQKKLLKDLIFSTRFKDIKNTSHAGNLAASILLAEYMSDDLEQYNSIVEELENAFEQFHDKYQFWLNVSKKHSPQSIKIAHVFAGLDKIAQLIQFQERLEKYAEVSNNSEIYHLLGAFESFYWLATVKKDIDSVEHNEQLFNKAIAYWQQALSIALTEKDKKEIRDHIAFMHHNLAMLTYHKDPQLAKDQLTSALKYSKNPVFELEKAFLILSSLYRSTTLEEKKWAEDILNEHGNDPEIVEEQSIFYKFLAIIFEQGDHGKGIESDIEKAQNYWRILTKASHTTPKAHDLYFEACYSYALNLAKKIYLSPKDLSPILSDSEKPEAYFNTLIQNKRLEGIVGLGLCFLWQGLYDDADKCFTDAVVQITPIPFTRETIKECPKDRYLQAQAFWYKGLIAYAKNNREHAFTLMGLALEKLPVTTKLDCLYAHTPQNLLMKFLVDAQRCLGNKSKDNVDVNGLYIAGRLLCSQQKYYEKGISFIAHALLQKQRFAQLYMGSCDNVPLVTFNNKVDLLQQIQPENPDDVCYMQARYYIEMYANWGILTALLDDAKKNWKEGSIDCWLENLVTKEFMYEYLFDNTTQKMPIVETLNDPQLYNHILNHASPGARLLQILIYASEKKVKEAIAIGEKLIRKLKTNANFDTDSHIPNLCTTLEYFLSVVKFRNALIIFNNDLSTPAALAQVLKDFNDIYKKGNNAAAFGIAASVLMGRVTPDKAKSILGLSQKDEVKKYVLEKILPLAVKEIKKQKKLDILLASRLIDTVMGFYVHNTDKNGKKIHQQFSNYSKELGLKK